MEKFPAMLSDTSHLAKKLFNKKVSFNQGKPFWSAIIFSLVSVCGGGAAFATPSQLFALSYATINDIVINNQLSNVETLSGVGAGFSTTGIAHDGNAFHVMFESDTDVADGDDELFILSYATINDIVINNQLSNVETLSGVGTGFSTTGIAHDGNAFHVMFESGTDVADGDDELFILSYATINDIVINNQLSNVETLSGVGTGFSTTGFTFDGNAFHVMFESDADVADGDDELFILSYATINDIVINNQLSNVETLSGVGTGFSSTGIAHDGNAFHVLFESDPSPGVTVSEPSTIALIGIGILGMTAYRRRCHQRREN